MAKVEFQSVNNWVVVNFTCDRLTDPATIAAATELLLGRLNHLPARARVCVSFQGVEFVSSQIIGTLLAMRERLDRLHGELVLCRVGPHVRDVLALTKLDRIFPIKDRLREVVGERRKHAYALSEISWFD